MSDKLKKTVVARILAPLTALVKTKFKFRRVHHSKKALSVRLNEDRP